jgi:dGTPase
MPELYKRFSEQLGRPVDEGEEHPSRSPVAKDRDRIIHSGALRRLQRKSQIVGVQSNDFFRTRLTHTLECAQIGRAIALRAKESDDVMTVVEEVDHVPPLVEAACYAHDLGHPPFGHNGEQALRELMAEHGRGMFEANAQSFRIVTPLEPNVAVDARWCGLDLTRTTLKAILKYPKTEFEAERAGEQKFCIYDEEPDLEVYDWLFDEPRDERDRTLATEIVDTADDIAYAVHDFEDGVWAGRIPLFRLVDESDRDARDELIPFLTKERRELFPSPEAVDEGLSALLAIPKEAEWAYRPFDRSLAASASLKKFAAGLIGDFIDAVTPDDKFAPPGDLTAQKLELLKAMARVWMIEHHEEATLRHGQRGLVRALIEGYWDNPSMLPLRGEWATLPAPEKGDFDASGGRPVGTEPKELRVGRAKARLICDHIAGMTDLYALHAHHEMYGGGVAPNLRLLV